MVSHLLSFAPLEMVVFDLCKPVGHMENFIISYAPIF